MTLTMRIRLKGGEDLNRKWRLFRKVPDVLYPEVDDIGSAIVRIAQQIAPRFEEGLSEGIQHEVQMQGMNLSLVISNDVPYSHYQEAGFEPHFAPITAYAKRWLEAHATGLEGHRPGKRGYFYVKKHTPHIDPAIEMVRPNIPFILKNGVDAFLNREFGGIGQ